MSGPTSLTAEQLLPVAVALEQRRRQLQRGHRIVLHPLPDCPLCDAAPDEVGTEPDPSLISDVVRIWFRPCGHRFTASGDVVMEVESQASQIVDNDEMRPVSEPSRSLGLRSQQPPEFVLALYEDDGTLLFGIRPDGQLECGPNYQPDEAAAEFWDAVTRAAQAANPWEAT